MAVLSEEINEHGTTFDIWERFLFITTMHFSRMRTVRCSSRLLGGGGLPARWRWCVPRGRVCPGGVCLQGGVCPGGVYPLGVCLGGLCPGGCLPARGWCLPSGGVCPGSLPARGDLPRRVSAWEVSAQGCVCLLGGVCLPAGGCILPLCGQTDTCENITFPQLLLRTVKILWERHYMRLSYGVTVCQFFCAGGGGMGELIFSDLH